jgi:hypothetical protein
MNANLLLEIKNFYKFSPEYINYKDKHNCTINKEKLDTFLNINSSK